MIKIDISECRGCLCTRLSLTLRKNMDEISYSAFCEDCRRNFDEVKIKGFNKITLEFFEDKLL